MVGPRRGAKRWQCSSMGIPSSHENLNEKLGLNALILVIGRAATLEQGEALHLWSPAWQPITLLAMHSCRAHLHRSVVSARDDCYSVPRWKGTARARASHLDASGWRVVRQLRARPRVRAMGSNEVSVVALCHPRHAGCARARGSIVGQASPHPSSAAASAIPAPP